MVRLAAVAAERIASQALHDSRIWIVDGDLGDSYGVDRFANSLGHRFVQAGIAEQTMVSLAAGLAACGQRPWVFSFAAFLCCRAYDQIRACIAQTNLPVVLIGSHAGGCNGKNGKSHTVLNDIAIMSTLPNIQVWAPADASDAIYAVDQIQRAKCPTYVRFPREKQPSVLDEAGPLCWFGNGDRFSVAMVSTGLATQWALRAQRLITLKGFRVPILHISKLKPAPVNEIRIALSDVKRLIVVDDHAQWGGVSDIVRRILPGIPQVSVAWPSDWAGASGNSTALRQACGLDDRMIAHHCLMQLEELVPPSLRHKPAATWATRAGPRRRTGRPDI